MYWIIFGAILHRHFMWKRNNIVVFLLAWIPQLDLVVRSWNALILLKSSWALTVSIHSAAPKMASKQFSPLPDRCCVYLHTEQACQFALDAPLEHSHQAVIDHAHSRVQAVSVRSFAQRGGNHLICSCFWSLWACGVGSFWYFASHQPGSSPWIILIGLRFRAFHSHTGAHKTFVLVAVQTAVSCLSCFAGTYTTGSGHRRIQEMWWV
jgi:hypothetical protein